MSYPRTSSSVALCNSFTPLCRSQFGYSSTIFVIVCFSNKHYIDDHFSICTTIVSSLKTSCDLKTSGYIRSGKMIRYFIRLFLFSCMLWKRNDNLGADERASLHSNLQRKENNNNSLVAITFECSKILQVTGHVLKICFQ